MDGWVQGEGNITLYGVVLQVMMVGEPFSQLRAKTRQWLWDQMATQAVCTVVEERSGGYWVVVRYHRSYDDLLNGRIFEFCDIEVPEQYIQKAAARYAEQGW